MVNAAAFASLQRQGIPLFSLTPAALHAHLRASKAAEEQETLEKHVPPEYHDFADVFSDSQADELPPHRPYDHTIDTEEGTTPPYGPIHALSPRELEAL